MCVFTSFDRRFFGSYCESLKQEPAIGVVPAGTGNDLARSLGQGNNWTDEKLSGPGTWNLGVFKLELLLETRKKKRG